jgi:hypothetical protein
MGKIPWVPMSKRGIRVCSVGWTEADWHAGWTSEKKEVE